MFMSVKLFLKLLTNFYM